MATRPDVLPELAMLDVNLPNTGNTNKLRPPVEVRETGYDYLQKPPAEEFNWLIHNIAQWLEYLDSLTRDQGITTPATKQQAEEGVSVDTIMTPSTTLDSIKYNAVPPGTVLHSARTSAPSGWLVCDGTFHSRSLYPRLFAAIGTTFGSTSSYNFRVPDLRHQFIRGAHPSGGRAVGKTETDSFRQHVHSGTTNSAGTHTHPLPTTTSLPGSVWGVPDNIWRQTSGNSGPEAGKPPAVTYSAGAHSHTFTTNYTGGSETRPQNVALLPIIKF